MESWSDSVIQELFIIDPPTKDIISMNENISVADICWAAGIIDGEGCITIHKRNPKAEKKATRSPYYRLDIKVKMVHKPAVERLKSIFGIGTILCEKPGKNSKRVAWKWLVYGKDCIEVLKHTIPHLTVKQKDATIALEFLPINIKTAFGHQRISPEVLARRDEMYKKMQAVKQYEWTE